MMNQKTTKPGTKWGVVLQGLTIGAVGFGTLAMSGCKEKKKVEPVVVEERDPEPVVVIPQWTLGDIIDELGVSDKVEVAPGISIANEDLARAAMTLAAGFVQGDMEQIKSVVTQNAMGPLDTLDFTGSWFEATDTIKRVRLIWAREQPREVLEPLPRLMAPWTATEAQEIFGISDDDSIGTEFATRHLGKDDRELYEEWGLMLTSTNEEAMTALLLWLLDRYAGDLEEEFDISILDDSKRIEEFVVAWITYIRAYGEPDKDWSEASEEEVADGVQWFRDEIDMYLNEQTRLFAKRHPMNEKTLVLFAIEHTNGESYLMGFSGQSNGPEWMLNNEYTRAEVKSRATDWDGLGFDGFMSGYVIQSKLKEVEEQDRDFKDRGVK